MSAISINLFFAERNWSGLVIADAASQNAKVLSAPRERLSELLAREEIARSGVYVLVGPSSSSSFGLEGYIGESDELGQRLRRHAKQKQFWNRAYVAVAKDSWFSKSHIRFLEAKLVEQAKQAPLITKVVNDKQNLEYERLSDGDRANLEDYVAFLKLIMPALGCPLYAFPELSPPPTGTRVLGGENVHFEMRKGGAVAMAYERDGSFYVTRGSTARVEEKLSLREGYRLSRRELATRGLLVPDPSRNLLLFTQDVPFNSPSDAAAVVGTTSLNGRIEWKVLGTKTTYDEWQRSQTGTRR